VSSESADNFGGVKGVGGNVFVVARDIAASDRLRTEIESRWGRRAVVSLAFSIAGGQFFPNVKYALGFGHACTRVAVAGADAPLASRELHV
ncbi:MAG: hypothetical protein WA879_06880, partial [Candidatus Acidiferrales bacterium]